MLGAIASGPVYDAHAGDGTPVQVRMDKETA